MVNKYCTFRFTHIVVCSVCAMAVVSQLPDIVARYHITVVSHPNNTIVGGKPNIIKTTHLFSIELLSTLVLMISIGSRRLCVRRQTWMFFVMGPNVTMQALCVYSIPCLLLVFYTYRLIACLKEADRRHSLLMQSPSLNNSAAFSSIAITGSLPKVNNDAKSMKRSQSHEHFQTNCKAPPTTPTTGCPSPVASVRSVVIKKPPSPVVKSAYRLHIPTATTKKRFGGGGTVTALISSRLLLKAKVDAQQRQRKKRVQLLRQNTRMLVVIIIAFLLIEIPVAIIFLFHFAVVQFRIRSDFIRENFNVVLIYRLVIVEQPHFGYLKVYH